MNTDSRTGGYILGSPFQAGVRVVETAIAGIVIPGDCHVDQKVGCLPVSKVES